jgi:dynactin-6
MPAAPKPPVSFTPTMIIADNASLTGTHRITIGANTVVHPRAKLTSAHAPITIGDNCIISERSSTGFQSRAAEYEVEGAVLGNGVVVEPGAVVEAKEVGEGCVIEANAKIGKGAILGKVGIQFSG